MATAPHVHHRELLEALDRLEVVAVEQTIWRAAWRTRDVLQGGTGGRWSPSAGPEALYTSETMDGALAEVYHHLALAPVFSSCDVLCYPLEVKTRQTLLLDTPTAIESVGLSLKHLRDRALAPCQAVGAAAHLMEFDSLWAPSARWPGRNLVLFLDALGQPDGLQPGAGQSVNWAAWREREDVSDMLRRKR